MCRYVATPQAKIISSSLSRSGRYAADASVWSAIVTMLATLDFNLAKDADGNEIPFKATFEGGPIEYVQIVFLGVWSYF